MREKKKLRRKTDGVKCVCVCWSPGTKQNRGTGSGIYVGAIFADVV